MKFIQAKIYGFGKWVDQTIKFPDTAPICFYGENESGKTTIQQFILYVLFGLPPRRLARYKPMNSNKIGGMLIVEDEDIGQYSIERIEQDVICYSPSGELKDAAWLHDRLQGLNREVFTSIYAFSAVDLTAIQTMKKAQLSDVLFSVGLTGSTHIYEAEKELDKKLDQLFKPKARVLMMNKQIKQTETAHEAMIDAQKKEAKYEEKQATMKQLHREKKQYDEQAATLQVKLFKEEKIQTSLPQLHAYGKDEAQLKAYPAKINFPENGLKRLEKLKETLLPLKSELQGIENRVQQDKEEQSANEAALYDRALLNEARNIVQQKASYDHLLEQQRSKQLQFKQCDTQLTNESSHIEMTVDEVDTLSLPFHLEKHWETLARDQEELLQIDEKQTSIREKLQYTEAKLTEDKQRLEGKQLTEEELNQLRRELTQIDPAEQAGRENRTWQRWKESRMKTAKNILIGSSVIAMIATIIALFMENFILLAIPFVLLVGGILQFFNVKRTIDFYIGDENSPDDRGTQPISAKSYEEKQQVLNEQFAITREIEAIDKALAQNSLEQTYWQNEQTEFLKKENDWIQQIEQERITYPFLQTTDVPYWTDLLAIIRNVKQLLSEKYQLKSDLDEITNQLQAIETKQLQVSKQLHGGDSLLTFEQIQEIIQVQQAKQQLMQQLDEQINVDETTIEDLQQKISVYEAELAELFMIAHVDSEEAYLQVAIDKTTLEQIHASMASTKAQLTLMFSEEEAEVLLQEKPNEQDVMLQLKRVQETLNETNEKQKTVNEQIAKLELEIEQLELSNDHSTAIYQYQIEVDTLHQQAKTWAILKVAQTALVEAKMNYQANHLEEVLHHTSTFFRKLTNGNYKRVFAPTENASFEVEGNDHIRYTIDKLSQGTVDQLYVALRLAISVVMSHRYKMPLMMDDAFVHFDEKRTHNMLEIIRQLAEEQQLILFTCNRMIANQLHSDHLSNIEQNR